MSENKTCLGVISQLNKTIYVPDFQREYAWDEQKIKKLFDSILSGYPIGSIVLWEYTDDPTELEFIYTFIDYWTKFTPSDRHRFNETIGSEEYISNRPLLLKDRGLLNEITNIPNQSPKLVVDGQQRLTSLNIGLSGGILLDENKAKNLYINLITSGQTILEDINSGNQDDLRFDLKFISSRETVIEKGDELYYKISHIAESESISNGGGGAKYKYKNEVETAVIDKYHNKYEDKSSEIKDTTELLYEKFVEGGLNITEHKTNSIDEVLQLFLRINIEDEQLETSDIIIAVLTSVWGQSEDNPINARHQIRDFVEEINSSFEVMPDITAEDVAKILLLLQDPQLGRDLEQRTINQIETDNIRKTKIIWEDGEIQEAIRQCFNMISDWNFQHLISSSSDMSYLYPIIYFFYVNKNADYISNPTEYSNFSGENTDEYLNTARIQYWICVTLLHKEYTTNRHSVTTEVLYETITEHSNGTFPLKELNKKLWQNKGFSPTLRPSDVSRGLEQSVSNKNPIALFTLLRLPFKYPEFESLELDHIQPNSVLRDEEKLINEFGFEEHQASTIQKDKDKMANRTLLNRQANNKKDNILLSDWLEKIRENTDNEKVEEFINFHFIPKDEELYQIENFLDFIDKRRELIRKAVEKKYKSLNKRNADPTASENYRTPDWF